MGGFFYRKVACIMRRPSSFEHKKYSEQVEIFKNRGMKFDDENRAMKTLSIVPYYKIKELARPYCKVIYVNDEKQLDYQETRFETILSRFYQDKNLRNSMFHAIEDIEMALKTQIAYVLGNIGAYEYLNFSAWCNREEYCKHFLKYKEEKLKREIQEAMKRTDSSEIKEKLKIDNFKFPPIWLMVDLLTFGQMVNLLELMSKNRIRQIASMFSCTDDELISWLKCINLVRNICAHNSSIIDIKFKTKPKIKDEWKTWLYEMKPGVYSNRVAVAVIVIKHMTLSINPRYKFGDIMGAFGKLINDDYSAKQYGFKSKDVLTLIYSAKPIVRRGRRQKRRV